MGTNACTTAILMSAACVWSAGSVSAACEERALTVVGTSLMPRIADGATVDAIVGVDCAFAPSRGNIVLFVSGAQSVPLAKVVAAEPGDRWSVTDEGGVLVNEAEIRNSADVAYRLDAARASMLRLYEAAYNGVIPPDSYLLLGERREGSLDSSQFGLVHRTDVIGKIERVHD